MSAKILYLLILLVINCFLLTKFLNFISAPDTFSCYLGLSGVVAQIFVSYHLVMNLIRSKS